MKDAIPAELEHEEQISSEPGLYLLASGSTKHQKRLHSRADSLLIGRRKLINHHTRVARSDAAAQKELANVS